jgi:hypothetical protein
MAVAVDVTGREGRRLTVVGISMNKRVFSMHYTLTMATEHARDFISCTGCGNFLKKCLQAQVYTKITSGTFAVSDSTKHH